VTRLTTCPDAETVAQRAAAHVKQVIVQAREQRGVAHVALSGGTTPGRTYELLGAEPSELEGLEVWFADERCVEPDDEQSNFRLASETLIAPASIAADRVHRMEGEVGPREGAERYAAEVSRYLATTQNGVPVFDLIVLGIGPDGHIASLFPGATTLDAGEQVVCLGVSDSPKPPPERLTLSLAVLNAAHGCLLLATGASKADAVEAMLGEASHHVPASLLRRERLTVILDDGAAPSKDL
jgi:6-phosphogluconolactonase